MKRKASKFLSLFPFLIVLALLFIQPLTTAQAPKQYALIAAGYWEPPPGGHLNYFVSGSSVSSSEFWGITVEQLAHYFRLNNTYKPWLATSWETSGDNFVVHLRPGITFSDGTPFTAKDVVSTFWILYLQKSILWNYIDDVKAVDDYTVSFHVVTPSPLIPYYVLTQPILPYSIYGYYSDKVMEYAKLGNSAKLNELLANFTSFRPDKFIGTGPYVLESITESQQVYVKRPDYWAELQGIAKIYFDKFIILRVTSDPQAAQLELASADDYDECGGFVKGQVEEVPKHLNATFVYHPLFSGPAIYFNLKVYPLSLKEVRQAIVYALNLSQAAHAGYAAVTTDTRLTGFDSTTVKTFISKEVYTSLTDYAYNPTKAEEILKGLGFKKGSDGVWVTPNGTRLEFEWIIPAGYATGRVGTQAAAQLTNFGIKVTVKAVEPATEYDRLVKGDFQIASDFWGGGMPLPWFSAEYWTYDLMPQVSGYPGPGFPMVYEYEGKTINVTDEAFKLNVGFDLSAQKPRVELLAKIFNEYVPFIPVGEKANVLFLSYERVQWPPTTLPDGSPAPWLYTYEGNLAWLIVHGLVVPKELLRAQAAQAELEKAREEAIAVAKSANATATTAISVAENARVAAQSAQAAASQATMVSLVSIIVAIASLVVAVMSMRKKSSE